MNKRLRSNVRPSKIAGGHLNLNGESISWRTFLIGFGVSALALVVAASYGLSPVWRDSVVELVLERSWRLSMPLGFLVPLWVFTLLNIPVVVAVDAIHTVFVRTQPTITMNATLYLSLSLGMSAVWWLLVAWVVGISRFALSRRRHRPRLP